MNTLDLLQAVNEVNFSDPAFVTSLRNQIDAAQAEFEDQTRRMTMKNEDLEAAYSL